MKITHTRKKHPSRIVIVVDGKKYTQEGGSTVAKEDDVRALVNQLIKDIVKPFFNVKFLIDSPIQTHVEITKIKSSVYKVIIEIERRLILGYVNHVENNPIIINNLDELNTYLILNH